MSSKVAWSPGSFALPGGFGAPGVFQARRFVPGGSRGCLTGRSLRSSLYCREVSGHTDPQHAAPQGHVARGGLTSRPVPKAFPVTQPGLGEEQAACVFRRCLHPHPVPSRSCSRQTGGVKPFFSVRIFSFFLSDLLFPSLSAFPASQRACSLRQPPESPGPGARSAL